MAVLKLLKTPVSGKKKFFCPLCLPVIESDERALIETLRGHEHRYQFFEVWLSTLSNYTPDLIPRLLSDFRQDFIFVLRERPGEGSYTSSWQSLITTVADTRALLDLDIELEREKLSWIKQRDLTVNLLLSYHNFEKTPERKVLEALIDEQFALGATICKICTHCESPEEELRLLDLGVTKHREGRRVIVLGMGKGGLATRIFGSLWYNELLYAPFELEKASAPGQLTYDEVISIYQELNHAR